MLANVSNKSIAKVMTRLTRKGWHRQSAEDWPHPRWPSLGRRRGRRRNWSGLSSSGPRRMSPPTPSPATRAGIRPDQLHHRTTQGARRKNRKPLKRTHHPAQHGTSSLEGLLRLPSAKKRPWGGFWGLNTKKGQAFGENNYKSSRSCTPQSLLFCFE